MYISSVIPRRVPVSVTVVGDGCPASALEEAQQERRTNGRAGAWPHRTHERSVSVSRSLMRTWRAVKPRLFKQLSRAADGPCRSDPSERERTHDAPQRGAGSEAEFAKASSSETRRPCSSGWRSGIDRFSR